MTQIELHDVRKSFREFTLGPVSATYGTGITALLGANGAGKSTLMRLVVGILRQDSGSVDVSGDDPRRRDIGYLPQDFAGPKNVVVNDYLRYVAWARSSRRHRLTDRDVHEALERVQLVDRAASRIGALSGGMVRRLGVAQALLGGGGAIVLDEPTVGLDPLQRRELRELLRELAADTTILLSTHLSEDVAAVADQVHVLHEGSVEMTGSVRDLATLGAADAVTGDAVEQGFLAVIGAAA